MLLVVARTIFIRRRRRAFAQGVTLLASLGLFNDSVARSQASPDAESLFVEGVALAEAGDCSAARVKFEASYAFDPAAGTLINLGLCEEKLGLLGTAYELLQQACEKLSTSDVRRPAVEKHLRSLAKRTSFARLFLPPTQPLQSVVVVNGIRIDARMLGRRMAMNPGTQIIEVRALGHRAGRYAFELEPGQTVEAMIEVGPSIGVGPLPPEVTGLSGEPVAVSPDRSRPDRATFLGWILAGASVTAVGVGVGTGLAASSHWNDVRANCDVVARTCRNEDGVAAGRSGRTLATVSTVAFAAGAIGALAGGYLIWSTGKKSAVAPVLLAGAAPGVASVEIAGGF